MLLVEADGKALLAAHGVTVPALDGDGPWMVKAQVPVGGRGKAGGIIRCLTRAEVDAARQRLIGTRIKGHQVEDCLVECAVTGEERYLAVMVDAASYGLRVIYSAHGGVDIEQSGSAHGRTCPAHPAAVAATLAALHAEAPVVELGRSIAELLLQRELALAEINPLFVSGTTCVAGDAKVVVDLSAVERQPEIAALIAARPRVYADANRKLTEGFDYVELDPDGEIGLITTGAGLSMMLIDELTARGMKPLNFCDIRTGQMRGSPTRLMRVLEWMTCRPSLKAVLVNVFAGITDLGEFGGLLATAIEQSPSLRVPVLARLVGRGATEAKRILAERRPGMLVTEDLEEAIRALPSTWPTSYSDTLGRNA